MKFYIISGLPERRERLKNHLKEVGVTDNFDIEWICEHQKDDPFVEWIRDFCAEHISHRTIAGFLNLCECFKRGVDSNESHFIVSNDDVVFINNWKEHFDKLKLDFINVISLGVNFHLLPDGVTKMTGNVGGMECIVVSKEFAEFFLNNIDFGQATDIVMSAIMVYHKVPLAITPICQQTSFLENKSLMDHSSTKYENDWIKFVQTYKPTRVTYRELYNNFTLYSKMRDVVERDFEERFGISISIHNKRYIIERFHAIKGSDQK